MSGLAFCWVGKTSASYARAGIDDYLERIERYAPCRVITLPEQRATKRYTAAHRIEREGVAIRERLEKLGTPWVTVLDPAGRSLTSRQFADRLRREWQEPRRLGVFVVGGPDGLCSSVRDRADLLLGLSHLTFPHDMARLLLAEQVYRAMTIIHGHPYDR